MRKTILGLAVALMSSSGFIHSADAQDAYPQKPVTIVVPWSPGGAVDNITRTIQPELEKFLGQSVLVDNRPGATGTIGHAAVGRAEPDGYTITLATNSTYAIAQNFLSPLPFDQQKDFAPIAIIASSPLLLSANAGRDIKDVAGLLELAKKDPGNITYSSGGVGVSSHMAMELFLSVTGTEMTHVPYQGGAPAGTALAGGEVDVAFLDIGASTQFVESGHIVPLAVGSAERSPKTPDVPTLSESSLDGFQAGTTFAFFAPAGTPEPVIAKLHQAIIHVTNDATIRASLEKQGIQITVSTPEELATSVTNEITQWRNLVAERNIKAN
jgi:tripartite-type tricarboxylate transporter receptor subunit TctC